MREGRETMQTDIRRTWSAHCRYRSDGPEFWLGTVEADGHESARAKLEALWTSLIPHPPPAQFWPVPGAVLFHPRA